MNLTSLWALVLDWAKLWDHPVGFFLALAISVCIEQTLGFIALRRSMSKMDRLGRPSLLRAVEGGIRDHAIDLIIYVLFLLLAYPFPQTQAVYLYLCDLICLMPHDVVEIKIREVEEGWKIRQSVRWDDGAQWGGCFMRGLERSWYHLLSYVLISVLDSNLAGGTHTFVQRRNGLLTDALGVFVNNCSSMICWQSPFARGGFFVAINGPRVLKYFQTSWLTQVFTALPGIALPLLASAEKLAPVLAVRRDGSSPAARGLDRQSTLPDRAGGRRGGSGAMTVQDGKSAWVAAMSNSQ